MAGALFGCYTASCCVGVCGYDRALSGIILLCTRRPCIVPGTYNVIRTADGSNVVRWQ